MYHILGFYVQICAYYINNSVIAVVNYRLSLTKECHSLWWTIYIYKFEQIVVKRQFLALWLFIELTYLFNSSLIRASLQKIQRHFILIHISRRLTTRSAVRPMNKSGKDVIYRTRTTP